MSRNSRGHDRLRGDHDQVRGDHDPRQGGHDPANFTHRPSATGLQLLRPVYGLVRVGDVQEKVLLVVLLEDKDESGPFEDITQYS